MPVFDPNSLDLFLVTGLVPVSKNITSDLFLGIGAACHHPDLLDFPVPIKPQLLYSRKTSYRESSKNHSLKFAECSQAQNEFIFLSGRHGVEGNDGASVFIFPSLPDIKVQHMVEGLL